MSTAMAGRPLFAVPPFGQGAGHASWSAPHPVTKDWHREEPRTNITGKTRTKINGSVQCAARTYTRPNVLCSVTSASNGFISCVHDYQHLPSGQLPSLDPVVTRRPNAPSPRTPMLTPPAPPFAILQINICKLWGKIDCVRDYMAKCSNSITAMQVRLNTSPKVPSGYSIIHTDRPSESGKDGGLAFIIHQDVHHRVHNLTSTDVHLEQQAIEVRKCSSSITTMNIYCPPASSCSSGYELSLSHLLHLDNTIIIGDFNADHHLWHSVLAGDTCRNQVTQKVKNSGIVILNEDIPTRVTS